MLLDPFFPNQLSIGWILAILINPKSVSLNTVLLIRYTYSEAFLKLGHFLSKEFFKVFAFISFALFAVVLYAFVFRVTGIS